VAAIVGSILVLFAAVDASVSEEGILKSCQEWLPRFMMPGDLLLLDAFPRLPSGKANSKALKEMFRESKAASLNDSNLLDEQSADLLRLVSDYLETPLRRQTLLSSAGVDSLTAIELSSYLRDAGYDVDTVSVLKMRTAGDLIDLARVRGPSSPSSKGVVSLLATLGFSISNTAPVQGDGRIVQDVLPCTPLQLAMLSETMRDSRAYWNELELELHTSRSVKEIATAFQTICLENTILRTGFLYHEGSYYAVVFKSLHRDSIAYVAEGEKQLLRPFNVKITPSTDPQVKHAIVDIHHAIYDGWSMDLLKSDLSRLLNGNLLPKRQQFHDLVAFHISPSFQDYNERAKMFWAEYLFGWSKPSLPKLAARSGHQGEITSALFESTVRCDALRKRSSDNGISPQIYFQAALALVWSGILGVSDIVLGSVTSGRALPVDGIESMIGPCMASMPLRIDVASVNSVWEMMNSVTSSNRKVMEHSTLSVLELKKLLGMRAVEQLYDVLFVYQDSPEQRRQTTSCVKEVRHLDYLETNLVIEVQPTNSTFAIQATYHAEHFPKDFVHHILQQLDHIAQKIIEDPSQSINDTKSTAGLSLSTHNFEAINGSNQSDSADLATLFEKTAKEHPDGIALSFATTFSDSRLSFENLTYRALNERANQLANFLISKQVRPGGIIAIVLPKSVMLYVAILATIKARCAYLPLLPSTPTSRVADVFSQARPSLCLTDTETSSLLPPYDSVVCLDRATFQDFSIANIPIRPDISLLAYVIYTSGTTGVPKGVAVTQENIVRNVTHLGSIYPISASHPRLLQACSQAFDVSVFEIFYAWHMGMCLCTAPNDALFEDIEAAIRIFKITHLSLTPTVAALINPRKVPTVEFLVTAGEPMTKAVQESWGCKLWQGYGPSETTNICSVKNMDCAEDSIEHLGWVFPNTSVAVLLPDSNIAAPLGWVGEFCFGGKQVAQEYLNMPKLTAEKFIDHPLYGRIYRSGDMGRLLPDKSLMILGRIDDQLKLRGQRIEASEVNSVVTSTTSATSAVTMLLRPEGHSNEQLVTFYVGDTGDETFQVADVDPNTNETLFAELLSRVPNYMVPSYLIPVSHIPLTSSGKVDKRLLKSAFTKLQPKALEAATHGAQDDDLDEWNDLELSVAASLAHSLGVPKETIHRWTSLTVLGLDSISAIRVSQDLGRSLNIIISVSKLLQNPTVAQLARYIITNKPSEDQSHNPQYFPTSFLEEIQSKFLKDSKKVISLLPCSPLQEAMLSRGKDSYYNKILFRIRVSPERMRSYWDEMSKRHSIFRTCFISTRHVKYPIAQVVQETWSIPWQEFEVTQPSLDDAINSHLKTVPEPLDTMVPPLSLALIRYKGSNFFSFICHHALYDGVAMECLWREVEALAKSQKLPPTISYELFLQEALNQPDDVESFWTQHFRGFQPQPFFETNPKKSMSQITHTTSLQGSLERVQARLRSLGISLLSMCQASWAQTLNSLCQTDDICFGNVVNGRTVGIKGIERLVAPCFNTLPIRQDLSGSIQNIEVAKLFQKLNVDLFRYQFTPLRLVQKLVSNARRGLFDTLLLMQQPLQTMDESVWTLEEDAGDMDIPLVCEVVPCPSLDSLVINIHHDMTTISTNLSAGIAELFKHILQEILSSPFSATKRENIPASILNNLKDYTPPRVKIQRSDESPDIDDSTLWTVDEKQVRDVLSMLSRVEAKSIAKSTTIFQLGLDSINAVQVASMLREKGFTVSTSDIVECQTSLKIAARTVENAYNNAKTEQPYDFGAFQEMALPQLDSRVRQTSATLSLYPCTPVQCAMVASFVGSNGQNYLNLLSFEIDSAVDASSVVHAWSTVAKQHPLLRTGFAPVRHAHCSFAMVQHATVLLSDLISIKHDATAFNLMDWKKGEATNILQHLYNPAWRVAVVQNDKVSEMHLLIHHSLYDANSLNDLLSSVKNVLDGGNIVAVPDIEPGLSTMMQESNTKQEEGIQFWQRQAHNVVVNSFPVMTPLREKTKSIRGSELISCLSFTALNDTTRTLGVSIQAAIQASWCRILASYLGESSVSFGVTLSGRTDESTLKTPLPCLVTLPVIGRNYTSNREQLRQMMQYATQMHKYRHLPLEVIQKALGHPGSSIFDTLIAYQKVKRKAENNHWAQTRDDATVEYPMSLEIEPQQNDDIVLRLTYADDVLPQEQACLLLEQFDLTLEHLVLYPDGVEDDMHKAKPSAFAITPPLYPDMAAPVKYLHEFVESRAVSEPNKVALEYVERIRNGKVLSSTWSFGQIDAIGNRIANMLQSLTKPGGIIAIHFDKCPEAYFAILGILKSGSAFVALDVNAPNARKEFILQDSKAPCLLTDLNSPINFETPCPIVRIDENSVKEFSPETPIVNTINPDSTCYCLYTSGTTGTPKGCEITHENTVQCMMAFQDLFKGHWADDSRWLQFAALHFDVSVLEQYWSWSVGMTVVAAKKEMILDDLIGFINALRITHIDLTPSLARLTHPDTVPTLCKGIFITGGEQLKQEILDAWGSKAVIYNAYGPTEATIGVTMYKRVPQNGRPSNIGQQFPNVGSFVFRQGSEIPVFRGGVGELCVSGKLVGKGYLNRPELTEDRFSTLEVFGERVYRTGDLVRILHDGCFEFLGRADDQVKLRGQRLEIGEIDHVIRSLHCIRDSATIVTKHISSGKDVLVAFIVSEEFKAGSLRILPDSHGLGNEARAVCREKLPGYMVPSYFFRLPFIPLSSNNKAEAKVLKSLFGGLSQEDVSKLSASSITTGRQLDNKSFNILATAVAEFCGIPVSSITQQTSIFDIGIDSITALQLSVHLQKRGLSTVTPATLLKNPILVDLSVALSTENISDSSVSVKRAKQLMHASAHKNRASVCRALDAQADELQSIHPCSPLQEGIMAKTMTGEYQGAYFNSFQMLLHPDASVKVLKEAWGILVQQTPILRCAFANTSDGYMQATFKQRTLPWLERSLKMSENIDLFLAKEWQVWVERNQETVIEPLKILYVDNEISRRVIIYIFHGIYDGISFDLILQNIQRLYQGDTVLQGPLFMDTLAHGPLSDHKIAKKGWLEYLKDWSPSTIHIDSEVSSNYGCSVSATAIIELGEIESVRQQHGTTTQSVLLSVWIATLQKFTMGIITAGVIISGRTINLDGVQETIGPLFNTLPFFVGNLSDQSWSALLSRCQQFNDLILDDPHMPLQNIQKWCSHGQSLFDNLFTYQIEQDVGYTQAPWDIEDGPSILDYPLAFEATKLANGKMRLHIVAQTSTSSKSSLEQIIDELKTNITLMQSGGDLPTSIGVPLQAQNADVRAQSHSLDAELEWTEEADLVRHELAVVANVPPADITPAVSMLELGLDSIEVIRLSSRLRGKGLIIPASQIMKAQSISGIMKKIEIMSYGSNQSSGGEKLQNIQNQLRTQLDRDGINLDNVETILPPTPLQEAMVSGMIRSDFMWYFNHEIFEVSAGIDVERLKESWRTVIRSSPILRTGFVEVADLQLDMSYAQLVYKAGDFIINTVALESKKELHDIVEQATQRARINDARSNLLQLTFATVGPQTFIVLSIAHALYDGWSLSLIHQDLQKSYSGIFNPRSSPDEFLAKSLDSWTTEATNFWGNYLDGAEATLVTETRQENTCVFRTTKRRKNDYTRVAEFCKRQNISLQALLQACWASVLAQRTRMLDVVFGAVLSGRDFEGAEDVMFPTMNTVAIRCIMHGTVGAFLRYIEGNLTDIREYQNFPLRKARTAAKLKGNFFDSLFMLQKQSTVEDTLELFQSVDGSAAVDYPICVEADVAGQHLTWTVACQQHRDSESLASQLVDQLDQVFQYLITHESEDLISFRGSQVSVAGLPAITLVNENQEGVKTPAVPAMDWTENGMKIREVLSSISNIPEDSIDISTTLYHLGLDSITAIKVSSLLKRKNLVIKPTDLMRATSIADMADMAGDNSDIDATAHPHVPVIWDPPADLDMTAIIERSGIPKQHVSLILPATPMQVHMMNVWSNTDGRIFYPEFWYHISKDYNERNVETAWQATCEKHAMLRTCLINTGGRNIPMVQAILQEVEDWSSVVESQPLAVCEFHKTADGRNMLCLRIHHALYDGVSLPTIVQTLSESLINKASQERENRDCWVSFTSRLYMTSVKASRKQFWTEYLGDISPTHDANAILASGSRTSFLQRSAVRDTSMSTLAAEHGVSIQSLAFAAFARSIAESDTVVFGIYLANRVNNSDMPSTFPTLNLVPLKADVNEGKSMVQIAKEIQEDIHCISTDGNADVGLWEIYDWTGIQITQFVNFLSLPDGDNDKTEILVPAEAQSGNETKYRRDSAIEHPSFANSAVGDSYPVSLQLQSPSDKHTNMK
jgi:amino acid adenylation domain-containing protein